jgi:hypothetical protein
LAVNIICDIKARQLETSVEGDGDPREWPLRDFCPHRNRDLCFKSPKEITG